MKNIWIIIYRARLTLIFLVLLIGVVNWYQNDDELQFNIFAAILVSLITAYLGISKQINEDDKVFRELFISFNEKYSGETNDLFNELRNGEKNDVNGNRKLIIIDYFNLCSEEFLWYKKNKIPRIVWKAWEAGIIENISIPIVKEIFQEETNSVRKKRSYYGFAEYISKKL